MSRLRAAHRSSSPYDTFCNPWTSQYLVRSIVHTPSRPKLATKRGNVEFRRATPTNLVVRKEAFTGANVLGGSHRTGLWLVDFRIEVERMNFGLQDSENSKTLPAHRPAALPLRPCFHSRLKKFTEFPLLEILAVFTSFTMQSLPNFCKRSLKTGPHDMLRKN